MKNDLPGYITLKEAEEIYNAKADTLKKRCQRGSFVGAIKQGKTWFVPRIPNVDPDKTIPENYPNLEFDAALTSNSSLYDAENDARAYLYSKNKTYAYAWEYGFYFLSLVFRHVKLKRDHLPTASYVTEAHSSLRGAFLMNLYGYHAQSYTLLRRTHEAVIKALAIRKKPEKLGKVALSSNRERSEHILGLNLDRLWKLESSFTHADTMKLIKTVKDMNSDKDLIGISYGPQVDGDIFRAAANTSIFWLYALIKSVPYLFEKAVAEYWYSKQEESLKFLKDYLISSKALVGEIENFDKCIDKELRKIGS